LRSKAEKLLGAVCVMLLTGLIGAADARCQTPLPAAAPAATPGAARWAGPFAGIAALGGWSTSGTSESLVASGAQFHHFNTLGAGPGGALNFGYDWQPASSGLVVGIVGEIGFLDDPAGQVLRTTTSLLSSGQVRMGVAAVPDVLFYGQTGIALANLSSRIDFGGPITRQNQATPGLTLGFGGEYALSVAPLMSLGRFISLFAEYQHIWWAAQTIDMPAAVPGLDFHWRRETNVVQAGARLRF
jgi:opacity protein-like surface antigen